MNRIAPLALVFFLASSAAADEESVDIGATVSLSPEAALCVTAEAAEDYHVHARAMAWDKVATLFDRKLCQPHFKAMRGTVVEKQAPEARSTAWYRIRFDSGEEVQGEFYAVADASWVQPAAPPAATQ